MTELVRNQARPLEISVTVQGSKTVDGAEQRELFTETTNTTLVLDNGAVLKLKARVMPGQCVFLRNDRSEREILCKVLESRQAGYTDLEFTVYDPNFWHIPTEQPAAAAATPEPQKVIEAPMAVSDPAPTVESGSSTSEGIPVTVPETGTTTPASPAPEATDESIPPDWDEAKDAELHAVLAAMEASSKGQPESPKKETKQTAPDASAEVRKRSEPSSGKAGSDKTTSNTTSEAKVLSSHRSQTRIRIAASPLDRGGAGDCLARDEWLVSQQSTTGSINPIKAASAGRHTGIANTCIDWCAKCQPRRSEPLSIDTEDSANPGAKSRCCGRTTSDHDNGRRGSRARKQRRRRFGCAQGR